MAGKQDAEAKAPGSIPSSQAGRERSIRWVYLWLLFSSLLTVPWMAWNLIALDTRQASLSYLSYAAAHYSDREPTWSPDGARIAFVSRRGDGEGEIYVMNADGSDLTNLTHNVAGDHSPAWSPDGAHIAFVSDRDGNLEIYVMNADGSGVVDLTNQPEVDHGPSWSPDGRLVAFVSGRVGGDSDILVMNADGTDLRDLTMRPADDSWPNWSPDGRRIAFQSVRDNNDEICVMNADGTGQTNLTNQRWDDRSPAWSPDGTRIAFESHRGDGNGEIYVMNADGSGVARLTHNTTYDSAPAWSPDGARIAFVSGRFDNGEIYVMNADGSGQMNLTGNSVWDDAPAWSPDGRLIAYSSERNGNEEVYVMQSDGTHARSLSAVSTDVTQAAPPPAIPLGEYVAAVAWPAMVHVVLLIPLWSRHLYVRRHGQQAVFLAVARVLSTVLLVGITRGALVGLWVVVNGGLWIFGSVWGLRQIRRGDCWLMRRRGEISELPRPWAVPKVAEPVPEAPGPVLAPGAMPAGQDDRAATIEALRAAFRTGSPEERQRALEALKALGEIEEF